jgi:hypothetical protein
MSASEIAFIAFAIVHQLDVFPTLKFRQANSIFFTLLCRNPLGCLMLAINYQETTWITSKTML